MNIPRFVASIILGTSLCFFGYAPASALDLTECATLVPGDPVYDVVVTEGIVYGLGDREKGTVPLLLDLYQPADPADPTNPIVSGPRLPPVLVIHGGAFLRGSRQFLPWVCMAAELAIRGFVVASIDYRTFISRDNPVLSERVAALPVTNNFDLLINAAIEDALTASDWLFDNANTNNTDPSRFGVMGSSAGGSTAFHLAYTVNDFDIDAHTLRYAVDFFGPAIIPRGDFVAAANHLETGEPPLFIVHGTDDTTVLISRSELLADRATDQEVPFEFHAIPGAGHGLEDINPHVVEVGPGLTIFNRMVEWIHAATRVQVEIDIKPWRSSNTIFPWYGIIPVAFLGSADFDVNDIDRTTLKFGHDGAAAFPWVLRGFDINHDSYDDLIVFFRASQSGIRCGNTEVTVIGSTFGDPSEPFFGVDSITTVYCF